MDQNSVAARFDELVQTYYRTWFRFHPESAVEVGVEGYAHLLTPGSDERRWSLICLNDELRVALEEIDVDALDPDRRVDFQVLSGSVQIENQYLLDLEPRCPDPRRWLPINAIYQLTIRAVDDLPHALGARLDAIPSHLKSAETSLAQRAAHIPPRWVASTITAAQRGAEFLRDLPSHPAVASLPRRAEVAASGARAAEALINFAEFLERDVTPVAKGEFACGHKYFELLLRQRHFLDVTPDALHAFGARLFERTRAELEAACFEQFGRRDYIGVVHEIQKRHPSLEKLLATYTERMRAAREFVVAKGLVTMPERERLDVVATPIFMRHEVPFAAYSDPASSDPEQHGRYYVTPPVNEEQLAEHDEVGLGHTSVHEAYPGHHLQFVTANRNAMARTLPRLLNPSACFYEGWALYCEQLMVEQGFLDRPESRIVLLRDRLWRALRVMLDVELHTLGLSFDAAADRMVAALGFPRAQAEADLAWYTRSPTVPLGYATGWALINALRDNVVGNGDGEALRSFHDRLLSVGSISAPLVIQRAFGQVPWTAARDAIVGKGV
ncbi:MAG: hypothetical protein A2W18_14605 [Candidatus Muproteobacteria bacterium RBG_16_60_9]|uniref:DUF885 domain-containing protein n=1 Tax=Candidatus Muproteobacteria bacterium RBG_16_60_9 TaxID=1817755 RepID=A0A1F6VDR1_9PROT|nr:MAG: hypothetical protein A2W18_14605 [Candidatus Muproteobacteria bacterium RBG_16_60_9]